ncbi:MAG: hypothetical protein HY716_14385 [Planctomycetes bacterium]|nr:hypothetical protein [Planctomycetota bacterium]
MKIAEGVAPARSGTSEASTPSWAGAFPHDGERQGIGADRRPIRNGRRRGPLGDVGGYLPLGNQFCVGIELAYSTADVTIADLDVEAGGVHVGLTLGVRW